MGCPKKCHENGEAEKTQLARDEHCRTHFFTTEFRSLSTGAKFDVAFFKPHDEECEWQRNVQTDKFYSMAYLISLYICEKFSRENIKSKFFTNALLNGSHTKK